MEASENQAVYINFLKSAVKVVWKDHWKTPRKLSENVNFCTGAPPVHLLGEVEGEGKERCL